MKRYQRVLSGNKTMVSSPCSNFLYEVSLYLKIRVSELKKLFGNDCEYLYIKFINVFFFLSGFSFTNIHDSRDSRERGRVSI